MAEPQSASEFCSQWDAGSRAWRSRALARLVKDAEALQSGERCATRNVVNDPVFGSLLFARFLTALRVSHAQQYPVSLELTAISAFITSASGVAYLRQFSTSGGFESVLFVLSGKGDSDVRRRYDADCSSALRLLCLCGYEKDACKKMIIEAKGVEAIIGCLMHSDNGEVVHHACALLVELGGGGHSVDVRNGILALLSNGSEHAVFAAMKVAAKLMGGRSGLDDHADCLVMPAIGALRYCGASTLVFAEDVLVSLVAKCINKRGAIFCLMRLTRKPAAISKDQVPASVSKEVVLGVIDRLLRSDDECCGYCAERPVLYLLFRILLPKMQPGQERLPHRAINGMSKAASILAALYTRVNQLALRDDRLSVRLEVVTTFYGSVLQNHEQLGAMTASPAIFAAALAADANLLLSMRTRLREIKALIRGDDARDDESVGIATYLLERADTDTVRESLATPDNLAATAAHVDTEEKAFGFEVRPPPMSSPLKTGISTSVWRRLRKLKNSNSALRTRKLKWNSPQDDSKEAAYKEHMERVMLNSLRTNELTTNPKQPLTPRRPVKTLAPKHSPLVGSQKAPALPGIITREVNVGKSKEMKEIFHM